MIGSFQYLFPRLKPGSVYIVEDIHANYWTLYRDQPESFIDFTRWLMDAMHASYIQRNSPYQFMEGHPKRLTEVDVLLAATIIDRIEVFDSVVVVHRAEEPKRCPPMKRENSRMYVRFFAVAEDIRYLTISSPRTIGLSH